MDPSRVSELLFGGRGEAVDADVVTYLASFEHDEDEDEEEAVRSVQELCASASPAFAALSQEEVTRRVLAFLSECRGEGEGGAGRSTAATTGVTADAAAAAAAAALVAALANLGVTDNNDDDVGARGSSGRGASTGAGSSSGGSSSESADGALAAAVGALADLVPPASCSDRAEARSFARYVLRERFGGDPDAAADWMLAAQGERVEEEAEDKEEDDDRAASGAAGTTTTTTTRLCAAVAQWRRVAKEREDEQRSEALARERDRQATLERFAWRPDGAGSGGGGGGGGGSRPLPPPAPKGAAAAAAAPRVRYLDGAPVTTKGEKYVVVSQKEEWDGGSRGRVKTKGKRGVGYA